MDINNYDNPKFLFINDVFIKDCVSIDDLFEQKFINKMKLDDIQCNKEYNMLPTIFKSVDTWVDHSTLKCWYCHLNFELTPIFIPKLIDKVNNDISIYTKGCFCSFSCAMSYINLHNHDLCNKINEKQKLLLLYKIFYNKIVDDIKESPPLYTMECYGGNISTKKYKELIKEINKIN
jgi:hypothetical protein